jgi:phage tail sheath gpL-like
MSVLKISITSGRPNSYLQKSFETAGGKEAISQRLVNFVTGVFTGTESAASSSSPPSIAFSVLGQETAASGTLTLTSAVATNTVTINGVTFTAIASGATGNQFNIGGSDTITAANLAASINASVTALVSGYVTASSSGTVVTVTSAFTGLSGNQTLIASGQGTIVASGARLTGGAVDPNAMTLSF